MSESPPVTTAHWAGGCHTRYPSTQFSVKRGVLNLYRKERARAYTTAVDGLSSIFRVLDVCNCSHRPWVLNACEPTG